MKKQAINPGKKVKEEIGLENLDTSCLHSVSHGPGSTLCAGENIMITSVTLLT